MDQYGKELTHRDRLVDILRQAYMDDTLVAGKGCECGLGNIIYAMAKDADADEETSKYLSGAWTKAFYTVPRDNDMARLLAVMGAIGIYRQDASRMQVMPLDEPNKHAMTALTITHLPVKVLLDLEWEFETNQIGDTKDEKMFNGLVACIDVLDRYFGTGDYAKGETKEKFVQVLNSRKKCLSM